MNDFHDHIGLSEQGLRRREEILRSAIGVARIWRWRRRSVQIAAAAVVVLVAILLNASLHQAARLPVRLVKNVQAPVAPAVKKTLPTDDGQVVITQIQTDPTLLQRLVVPPQKPTWKILSDDELLRVLADAGKPAGLDYEANGQVAVLYRNP